MRFELFLGPRSLGHVSLEREGWVVVAVRDPGERAALLERLGGPASQAEADVVRFRPDGLTPGGFEHVLAAIAAERGYRLAARPVR